MNTTKNRVVNDPLAVIYNEGLWRVCRVSPLFNLQSSALKYKQYASKIRQAIARNVPSSSGIKYLVQLEDQPYLKYSEDDPQSFSITVTSSQGNKTKVIYMCIFLSWGVSSKVTQAIHLPFMLEHGEQKIATTVRATLQNIFDCNIKQFCFSQHQLLQFAFNIVEIDTSRSTDPITFCYRIQGDHKNNLHLSVEFGDINLIWNGIKGDFAKPLDKITLAYHIIQNQIFYTIMLDVTPLALHEIKLSKAEVKSNGTIKMKTPDIVNSVFTVLNEIIGYNNKETNN
ncbi:uncharacterized protein [Battus philenor]|uniref:uncharacterized protein n=1 Tax=Battus philenor TaxID=42288 RepID=UPI0035CECD65